MKPFFFILSIVLISCGQENRNTNKSHETNTSQNKVNGTIAEKTIDYNQPDSTLYNFALTNLRPGKHHLKIIYPYKVLRDTLIYSSKDSLLIYSYNVDTIANGYTELRPWTGQLIKEWANDTIRKNVKEFISLLHKAKGCQGIIFAYGDCAIEVFTFIDNKIALRAKHIYPYTAGYIFPKTLSFVSAKSNKLYVFHARYMGPSWDLKGEYEKFEKFIK